MSLPPEGANQTTGGVIALIKLVVANPTTWPMVITGVLLFELHTFLDRFIAQQNALLARLDTLTEAIRNLERVVR